MLTATEVLSIVEKESPASTYTDQHVSLLETSRKVENDAQYGSMTEVGSEADSLTINMTGSNPSNSELRDQIMVEDQADDEKNRVKMTLWEEDEEYKPSTCFIFFRIHGIICTISLGIMAIAQFFPLPHDKPFIFITLLRFYVLLGSCIGIVVELDISEWFVENAVPLLDNWFIRGAFYLLLGLVATGESSVSVEDFSNGFIKFLSAIGAHFVSMLLWISASGLMLTGSIYIMLGLFCLKGCKDRIDAEHEKHVEELHERMKSSSLF